MSGRFSIDAIFRARDRITRPVRRMERGIRRFQNRVERGFRGMRQFARRFRTAFLAVGAAIGVVSVAAARALEHVIETGRGFDQAITAAAAKFPGQIRRGTEAFRNLEEAAQRVGRETEFSASQAAEALDFLAMAGFNADQAVAALPGVVNLATAAQMELAEATDIASDTLGAFGLMTEDAAQLSTNLARVNDVLARTSTSANTTVEQMFEAIRTGGSTARAAGASIETYSALLGELAGSGIKGAEAGTALRNVFLRLQNPARAARRHLRRLHIDVADSEGNFRDIIDVMGDFERALEGMGSAERGRILSDVFGARSVNAVNTLLSSGSERLREYRTALEGAEGAAGEMAATMRDTAQGDLNSMNSAIEGLELQIWDLVRGPYRAAVQGITEWVRANQGAISGALSAVADFITEHQDAIGAFVRVIGVALAVLAAIFIAIPVMLMAAAAVVSAVFWAIVTVVVEAIDWIASVAPEVAQTVVSFVRGMWQRMTDFLTGVQEFVVGLFVILREAVMPHLQPVLELIGRAASWVREQWAPIGTFLDELWNTASETVRGTWVDVMEGAGSAVDAIRDAFAPLAAFFSELWSGIVTAYDNTVGGIVEGIGNLVNRVRGVGAAELAGQGAQAAAEAPQVVTQAEQVARSVSEHTQRDVIDIAVRAEQGASATVTRRPRGRRIQTQRSGAF